MPKYILFQSICYAITIDNSILDPSNPGSKVNQSTKKTPFSQSLDACISYERSPLKLLLEATITAFITTTHSRLSRLDIFIYHFTSKF